MTVLAFDVYGTLVDTAGITEALRPIVGEIAGDFARRWREKQLEYTFRRALMKRYVEFPVCVRQSLDHTASALNVLIDDDHRERLLAGFRKLPTYPDAIAALDRLRQTGARMFAFSNGTARDVGSLLTHGGIRGYFDGIVSLMDIRTYKPDPAAYDYLRRASVAREEDVWLVSGNPFDVIGAISAGLKGAWVRRGFCEYDPWEFPPTATIATLAELPALIGRPSPPAGSVAR
jgi:2-haloacid dehalogenase